MNHSEGKQARKSIKIQEVNNTTFGNSIVFID